MTWIAYSRYLELSRAGKIGRLWPSDTGSGWLLSHPPLHLHSCAEDISTSRLYALIAELDGGKPIPMDPPPLCSIPPRRDVQSAHSSDYWIDKYRKFGT